MGPRKEEKADGIVRSPQVVFARPTALPVKIGQREPLRKERNLQGRRAGGPEWNPEEEKTHGEQEGEVSGRVNSGRLTETSKMEQSLEAGCSSRRHRRCGTATVRTAVSLLEYRNTTPNGAG